MMLSSQVGSAIVFLLLAKFSTIDVRNVLEGNAILIVLSPLLAPVAAQFGIDPVHFGIVFIINATIGTITPPLGNGDVDVPVVSPALALLPLFETMPFWMVMVGILLLTTFCTRDFARAACPRFLNKC